MDVQLIQIGTIAYQGRQTSTNRIKVAPSATLKNVGFGDAAWIPKFDSLGNYPHTPPDQHPVPGLEHVPDQTMDASSNWVRRVSSMLFLPSTKTV